MKKGKIKVLDTNVVLLDPDSLFSISETDDVVIPFVLLQEIDNNKSRQGSVGINARQFIRNLDELRVKGNLYDGVKYKNNQGTVFVRLPPNFSNLPTGMDVNIPDNQIVATVLEMRVEDPKREIVLISNDINLRLRADAFRLNAEEYNQVGNAKKPKDLYSGIEEIVVEDEVIDKFYAGQDVCLKSKKSLPLYPNEYIVLKSELNEKKSALARFVKDDYPLAKLMLEKDCWGIMPRNKEQKFVLDAVLNKDISLVTLTGIAGAGKTILVLAGALEAVFTRKIYKKILVIRPVVTLGKEIGFLPGSIEEKLAPFIMPIVDNLNFLFNDDKNTLDIYLEKRTIELEAMSFIRGRSLADSIIIIDEAQNLSHHEAKTLLTRASENSKVIMLGDTHQIDTLHLNEMNNGLTRAVEIMKFYDLSAHVTLQKGERSSLATLAAKVM